MVSTVRSPFQGDESRFVTSCTTWDAIPAADAADEALRRRRQLAWPTAPNSSYTASSEPCGIDDRPRAIAVEAVEHSAVPNHLGDGVVDGDARVVAQRIDRRDQLALAGRSGLALAEAADGRAAQVAQVGAAAQQAPEVVGQRADVGARRAPHLDPQHRRIVGGRRRRTSAR